MSIQVELLADKRTLLLTYPGKVKWESDMRAALRDVIDALDQVEAFPIYQIVDMTALPNLSFSDVVQALGHIARSPEGQILREYDIQVIYVGTSDLVRLAADAMKQEQYGGQQIPVFDTLGEAAAYVQEQMAAVS